MARNVLTIKQGFSVQKKDPEKKSLEIKFGPDTTLSNKADKRTRNLSGHVVKVNLAGESCSMEGVTSSRLAKPGTDSSAI